MKYDEVVGKADDLKELTNEIRRLKTENPGSVLYHNREGHIRMWLISEGYNDKASKLRDDMPLDEIIDVLEENHQKDEERGGPHGRGQGMGMKGQGMGQHHGPGNQRRKKSTTQRPRTMQR